MTKQVQMPLFAEAEGREPLTGQLLKWIGNKQRVAGTIIAFFPQRFGTYFEPFLGSGGVLGTLGPPDALATDCFRPLIEIWQTLRESPETLNQWYSERWHRMMDGNKIAAFEAIKRSYNADPNAADLLFLCRSCYGGVVRFRQRDGHISTPCGIHSPIHPNSFARRVDSWRKRVSGARFLQMDFADALSQARSGDLVYCDPPYTDTQAILYGAQSFSLERLMQVIGECKRRGVFVALSIDGTKKSGSKICELLIPKGLFEREVFIHCGRSMLRRFQMNGQTLESENVADRLLLTY